MKDGNRVNNRLNLALLLVLTTAGTQALAQDRAAAAKSYGISAFAGVAAVSTDFAGTDHGFVLGGDITRGYRLFSPSLEYRFSDGVGSSVDERSSLVGLKLEKRWHRLNPYIDLLFGLGTITYNQTASTSYTHDNSLVLNAGGGPGLRPHLALRAQTRRPGPVLEAR